MLYSLQNEKKSYVRQKSRQNIWLLLCVNSRFYSRLNCFLPWIFNLLQMIENFTTLRQLLCYFLGSYSYELFFLFISPCLTKGLLVNCHMWKTGNFQCLWRVSIVLLLKLILTFWISLLIHQKCMQWLRQLIFCTKIIRKMTDDTPLQKDTNCNASNSTVHCKPQSKHFRC